MRERLVIAVVTALLIVDLAACVVCAIYGNKQRSQPFLDTWAHHAEQTASEPKH